MWPTVVVKDGTMTERRYLKRDLTRRTSCAQNTKRNTVAITSSCISMAAATALRLKGETQRNSRARQKFEASVYKHWRLHASHRNTALDKQRTDTFFEVHFQLLFAPDPSP
ncbi:hypothetical protein EYF80_026432 [Liparis tanakae]|uniref:Uncharacterized protein n=1 Tax=Liparis tanakae TaxID=230148 RepID=A0A4Z2HCV5_9TELE|nr:hypothetical protein EYF80_026432 [Liparis tanakae]